MLPFGKEAVRGNGYAGSTYALDRHVPAIKSGMRFAGGSVTEGWPISTDPDAHVKAISELFESGATEVHIHSGQPDQKRVIEFYGKQVLPRLKKVLAGKSSAA